MAAGLPLSSERHRAAPKPALLWILGLAGVAFCACTAVLASLNEELYQPALRVLLVIWLTLPFILRRTRRHGEGGPTAPSGH